MSTSTCHPWIGYKWSKYLLGSTHLICIIFSTSYESMHVPCVYVQSTTYHVNTWNPKIIIFWICRFKKTGMTIIHDLGVLVCAHKLVHIQQRESSPKILYQFSIADQHARIFQADIAWNWPAPWLHFWMDGLFWGIRCQNCFNCSVKMAISSGEPKSFQAAVSHPGSKSLLAEPVEAPFGMISNAKQLQLLHFSKQQPDPTLPHAPVTSWPPCLRAGAQRSQSAPGNRGNHGNLLVIFLPF